MSEVKPVAWATALALLGVQNAEDGRRPRAVLLSRECAGGRRIGLILDADHERVVAELRAENERLRRESDGRLAALHDKAEEAKQEWLRAERAEARVAELEAQFRENARKAREQAAFEAAGAWDDAATAIEQQLAALQGGEA